MAWFKKNKKSNEEPLKKDPNSKVPLRPINYSNMVVLAWAKAVEGNLDIQKWLVEHGYEELVHA